MLNQRHIAIACGGTGGHLFPGLAVAGQLVEHGCAVTILTSPKEVDHEAVKTAQGMEVLALPAVGLTRGSFLEFSRGFARSYRAARQRFQARPVCAALAMGGFTSAPPILAAKRLGARAFLHESNTVPGRANRLLSWVVDEAFVGFPSTAAHLHRSKVKLTGTPVRSEIVVSSPAACRTALGLEPDRPVVLVIGGSQGASGINELVIKALPLFARIVPHWQWFHLTGAQDFEKVKAAYMAKGLTAAVHPFFSKMGLVLGGASAALSRAGASSLAEFAATRLPAVLVPYPTAIDDHQFHNARAYVNTESARLLEQRIANSEALLRILQELIENSAIRARMQHALAQWHSPMAARQIAYTILTSVGVQVERVPEAPISAPDSVPLMRPGAGAQTPRTQSASHQEVIA